MSAEHPTDGAALVGAAARLIFVFAAESALVFLDLGAHLSLQGRPGHIRQARTAILDDGQVVALNREIILRAANTKRRHTFQRAFDLVKRDSFHFSS
jgi:hypothetical protein